MTKYLNLKSLLISLTALLCVIGGVIIAGEITTVSAPIDTMYTLEDIYNLTNNTTSSIHTLTPSAPTASSMHSTSEIYVALANLIQAEYLASTSVTYLGVTGGEATPTPVDAITKEFTPTSLAGTVTGFTLEDIYNLITENTRLTTPGHSYAPSANPTATMYTLTEIYEALQTLAAEKAPSVVVGMTYLGVEGSYAFSGPYTLTFSTEDANGSLVATVNDVEVVSGEAVEGGSVVTFTATPDDGYFVDEWSINGLVQDGENNNEFIIEELQENTDVVVSFVDYSTWLLLDMPFEGGSDASTTPDLSAYSNDGTVVGPVWSDSSGYNSSGGYLFNANYITLGTQESLQNLGEMSIEAWVKPTFLWGGPTGNRIMCVSPWGWVTGRWCLYFYSGDSIHWSVINSSGSGTEGVYSNGSTFTLDQWYHVVATYNGASVSVYVNGNKGGTSGSLTGTISSANIPIYIGYNVMDYYKGYLDGVKIYNKGLTSEQVNTLYYR